ATHGEQPGWISRHTAAYDAASRQIVVRGGQRFVSEHELVDNEAVYALDLATLAWRRLGD
ncbi:MAG TPA: hypothetical protein VLA19_08385, partial [Herpetosiphonaceae bacterium]|nr:hypothetical protein [Herpetosiphonaceae bacterium]